MDMMKIPERCSMGKIRIVEEREGYLLLARGERFAVVERRNGKLYRLECGHRDSEPISDLGMMHAVGDHGWCDEITARRLLNEILVRYHDLAERMW
jgi:hypothetical protein